MSTQVLSQILFDIQKVDQFFDISMILPTVGSMGCESKSWL
jgi:hypothetical protein